MMLIRASLHGRLIGRRRPRGFDWSLAKTAPASRAKCKKCYSLRRMAYRWRSRPDIAAQEAALAAARSELIRLRRKLTTKEGYAAKLELVLHQRLETIDTLNGKLEQERAAKQRLDEECEHLAQLVRLG
jgi:hypothetical protein